MLDVTGFNEYNINLNSVIGNDARCTKIEEGGGGFFFFFFVLLATRRHKQKHPFLVQKCRQRSVLTKNRVPTNQIHRLNQQH